MAIYPPELTLPYAVSNSWLEDRTLAGDMVEAGPPLIIALDAVAEDLRERAAALTMDINVEYYDFTGTVEVISSGIEVLSQKRADGTLVAMHGPIIRKIGPVPELSAPTTDAGELITAYEAWRDRYRDLAPMGLTAWLEAWSTDDEPDSEDKYPNGADESMFIAEMLLLVNGEQTSRQINGREDDLEIFRRTRAAWALYHHAAHAVEKEDWQFALQLVGKGADMPRWLPDEEALPSFEDYARRIAHVAFSRWWRRQRERDGFDREMRRWTLEHGSERLKIGIADGYRMIPVYLDERLAADVPGFYAHLTKKDDKHTWQPRTGPSEEALRLRRAVQDRLNRHAPPGTEPPSAEIGWIKMPPLQMCDEAHAYDEDEWGHREDEIKGTPFEIIVVKEWLGRYTLMAAVYTEADEQPPDYLLLKYVLDPHAYELEGMPSPPAGKSIAAVGDFQPVARGTGDDDIPF
jgi:hypothetical protein